MAIEYVIGEHVGGARSSERETRLINKVAQALVGEEELANPTKVTVVDCAYTSSVRVQENTVCEGEGGWNRGGRRFASLETRLFAQRVGGGRQVVCETRGYKIWFMGVWRPCYASD